MHCFSPGVVGWLAASCCTIILLVEVLYQQPAVPTTTITTSSTTGCCSTKLLERGVVPGRVVGVVGHAHSIHHVSYKSIAEFVTMGTVQLILCISCRFSNAELRNL